MDAFSALLLLLVIAGVIFWIVKANAADLRKLADRLGLAVIPKGETETGQDPGIGAYSQTLVLSGEMHGFPAVVLNRTLGRKSGLHNRTSSAFTVLALDLPSPVKTRFRLDPARIGKLQAFFGSSLPAIPTGDEAFDSLYRLSADNAGAALALLTPRLRDLLQAFRSGAAPGMPDNFLGKFSGDLIAGSFVVEGRRVSYILSGTPTASLGPRLEMAARLLAELARSL